MSDIRRELNELSERKLEVLDKVLSDLSEIIRGKEVELLRTYFVTGWLLGAIEAQLAQANISEESQINLSFNYRMTCKIFENVNADYLKSLDIDLEQLFEEGE